MRNELCLTQKTYISFGKINEKILNPAKKELKDKTDIEIYVEPRKEGKKVIGLDITVTEHLRIQNNNIHIDNDKDGKYLELTNVYGKTLVDAAKEYTDRRENVTNYWAYIEGVLKQSEKNKGKINSENIGNGNYTSNNSKRLRGKQFTEEVNNFKELENDLLDWYCN